VAPSIQLLSSVGRDPGWQKPGHLTRQQARPILPHGTQLPLVRIPAPPRMPQPRRQRNSRRARQPRMPHRVIAQPAEPPAKRITDVVHHPGQLSPQRLRPPQNLGNPPCQQTCQQNRPPYGPHHQHDQGAVCPQPPQQPPPGPQRLPTYQSTPPARYWAAPTLTARRAAAQPACQASASRRLTRKNGPRSAATAGYQLNAVASCLLDQGQATAVRALVLARASWR